MKKNENKCEKSLISSLNKIVLIVACNFYSLITIAQKSLLPVDNHIDSINRKEIIYYKQQKDLIDVLLLILQKNPSQRIDSLHLKSKSIKVSASPIIEYTLSTGFTTGIAANGAFYTSVLKNTNISSFLGAIKYTQKKQFMLPIQTSLWTPGNKFNLFGDWRYFNFPQDTYGIGGLTSTTNKYIVNYKYIRFYEAILKNISNNYYVGIGYQLDHHWAINEMEIAPGQLTDFKLYGFNKKSTSSAISLQLIYDSRNNSINPEGGSMYGNIQFIQNSTLIGSNTNWNSVLIDLRKYYKVSQNSILGFWIYSVITLSGSPPYLDLPGTGNDTYTNTGRGYEQGRFIGKKYVDLEAEYRFGITRNGLIGAVVFCSAGSVSELNSGSFKTIIPGIGAGLRIKFNKFSKTNTCLDYGFGKHNSHGFSGNLGEVF